MPETVVREGTCVPTACGGAACCKVLAAPSGTAYPVVDDVRHTVRIKAPENVSALYREFLDARGLHEDAEGFMAIPFDPARRAEIRLSMYGPERMRVVFIPHTCPHLTPEDKCDLHGTDAKPAACVGYPQAGGDDLSCVPGCSFKMVKR